MRLDLFHHGILDRFRLSVRLHLLDFARAEVGCHHDDRVLEVHRAALSVGHAAIVKNLQQDVEHVGMRLFDLVEQNHAVGLAAHGFRQVAALFITHISGRRTDQTSHRVLLHEFAHVDAHHRLIAIKEEVG